MYVYFVLYVLCICYGMWTDLTRLLIPNIVSIVLLALFVPYAVFNFEPMLILHHIGIALAVFAVTVTFYVFGWMGAGDVKFMTATSVWMGPSLILTFLVQMGLLGAVFAVFILLTRKYADLWRGVALRVPPLEFMIALADKRRVPYGVPIGGAALWAAPKVFML
ncbi:MAG: prepilin peptidase [Pseudomonadota bacterium]